MKSTMNDPGIAAAIIVLAASSAALMKTSSDSLISIPYVIRIIRDADMLIAINIACQQERRTKLTA